MPHHKFKVGEVVNFTPSRPGVATPGSQYEIIRVLPADGTSDRIARARLEHIGTMSRDDAVIARKDVLEAIERLKTFEKLLTRKIDAAG